MNSYLFNKFFFIFFIIFSSPSCRLRQRKRRASTSTWTARRQDTPPPRRRRFSSLSRTDSLSNDKLENLLKEIKANRDYEKNPNSNCLANDKDRDSLELPPPCTCPYFGDKSPTHHKSFKPTEVKIIPTFQQCHSDKNNLPTSSSKSLSVLPTTAITSPNRKLSYSKPNSVVTWDSRRHQRRGSSFGGARTSLLLTPTKSANSQLRRSATLRQQNNIVNGDGSIDKKIPSSPCLLQRSTTIRSHHSRNSSVISRNSSRHGRIIRLEQKATKVLGVVFFTFVILWAPFFVLNLVPTVCGTCEDNISHWVFDFVTWLGYASSMVNPIFYTIFNKVFRQAFKKVLLCEYRKKAGWRPQR